MSLQDIIRAWRDRAFRESLSEEQQALLPENPIGEVLGQEELFRVSGGVFTYTESPGCVDTSAAACGVGGGGGGGGGGGAPSTVICTVSNNTCQYECREP